MNDQIALPCAFEMASLPGLQPQLYQQVDLGNISAVANNSLASKELLGSSNRQHTSLQPLASEPLMYTEKEETIEKYFRADRRAMKPRGAEEDSELESPEFEQMDL